MHGTISRRSGFRPEGLKLFALSFQLPEVAVPSEAIACATCGLVWCELDAATLREKLGDLGNDEIKEHLGLDQASRVVSLRAAHVLGKR
ncbi:MAG: hypothetical protein ABSH35_32575 [Isosphaeraceae bacterium]